VARHQDDQLDPLAEEKRVGAYQDRANALLLDGRERAARSRESCQWCCRPNSTSSSISKPRNRWALTFRVLCAQIDQRFRCEKITVAHSITSSARASNQV
jgi:hypothetical protein